MDSFVKKHPQGSGMDSQRWIVPHFQLGGHGTEGSHAFRNTPFVLAKLGNIPNWLNTLSERAGTWMFLPGSFCYSNIVLLRSTSWPQRLSISAPLPENTDSGKERASSLGIRSSRTAVPLFRKTSPM